MNEQEWVTTHDLGEGLSNVTMESLGGVNWADAPLPSRWHRCTAQTRGWIGLDYTERCACGASRHERGPWIRKNETRKGQARERREDRLPRVQVTCRECGQGYEAAEGTRIARQRLCNNCWAGRFVGSGGGLV